MAVQLMEKIQTITAFLLIALASVSYGQPSHFEHTKSLAEQGDAEAQVILGYLYAVGDGIPENDAEAIKWFLLAAEQGNAMQ